MDRSIPYNPEAAPSGPQGPRAQGLAALRAARIMLLSAETARQWCLLDGWSREDCIHLLMDLDPAEFRALQQVAARWSDQDYFNESAPDPAARQQIAAYRTACDELGRERIRHRVEGALIAAEESGTLRFPATPRTVMSWAAEKELTEYCPVLTTAMRLVGDGGGGGKADSKARDWPWGHYETELLRHLAAATARFWNLFDPSDPSTAPTNEQVASWLRKRGVSGRVAEVIAQILRADSLPAGRRKS